jgi:hypothetical protein
MDAKYVRDIAQLPELSERGVFLNVPYDARFQPLYVAYIVGLTQLGLTPVMPLAIPGGRARIDRIFELLQTCRYSIHDLSRVQVNRARANTPRFNMPFELGLAVAWSKLHPERHTFFAMEAVRGRASQSLSDMAATDFNIHGNTEQGVMRELCNAFVRPGPRPTVPAMMKRYADVLDFIPKLRRDTGLRTLYEARAFDELVAFAMYVRN